MCINREYKCQFDRKIDGNKESATIEAVNENGKFVWKYETQKYDCCMLDRISEVGIRNEKYYLVEDGTIITFDLRNGNVIWKNSDFGGNVHHMYSMIMIIYICVGMMRQIFML